VVGFDQQQAEVQLQQGSGDFFTTNSTSTTRLSSSTSSSTATSSSSSSSTSSTPAPQPNGKTTSENATNFDQPSDQTSRMSKSSTFAAGFGGGLVMMAVVGGAVYGIARRRTINGQAAPNPRLLLVSKNDA
jgi:hypothetical protein